jgi:hypothetical protein
MILKNIENELLTLHVRLDLPTQEEIDEYDMEMDASISLGSDIENDIDGYYVLNIKDILLEGAEDKDSAEAIISWLNFYLREVFKKLRMYNDEEEVNHEN